MLIGLAGLAGSGKDTVGKILEQQHGFRTKAFAGPLKEAAKIVFGWNDDHVHGHLKEVVDPYWGFSPRWALQRMGTEAMRDNIDKDVWVKATLRPPLTNVVVTDVRFPNEVKAVKESNGFTIWIERPGLTRMDHLSEQLDSSFCPFIIHNNGTFRDLRRKVDQLLETLNAKF